MARPKRNIGGLLVRLSVVRRVYVGRPLVRYRTDTAKFPGYYLATTIRDTIKVPRDFNSRPAPRKATVAPSEVRACNMPEYRIYGIGGDGHFVDAKNIECADDQEATKGRQSVCLIC